MGLTGSTGPIQLDLTLDGLPTPEGDLRGVLSGLLARVRELTLRGAPADRPWILTWDGMPCPANLTRLHVQNLLLDPVALRMVKAWDLQQLRELRLSGIGLASADDESAACLAEFVAQLSGLQHLDLERPGSERHPPGPTPIPWARTASRAVGCPKTPSRDSEPCRWRSTARGRPSRCGHACWRRAPCWRTWW